MKSCLSIILIFFFHVGLSAQEINHQQKINNIVSFANLYGYVRYFHPSDEASKINWEEFVYYGIKTVENAPNPIILNQKLIELFVPIAPSILIKPGIKAHEFNVKSITPAISMAMRDTVTWQHYGMGVANILYKSIRTNRPYKIVNDKSRGYGNAINHIDAKPYRGMKIRLKSSIKVADGGTGQMWIRVDRENKIMGFFENMDSRPVKKESWGTYEIIGNVDSDAVSIVFGTFLAGSGKVWIDDFSLEVEDNGKWMQIPIKNASFEDDAKSPKDWLANAPGYQYEMVSGDATNGNYSLLIQEGSMTKTEKQIFDNKPKFGEYFIKDIGTGLTCLVPLVLMGNEAITYPTANPVQLSNLMTKIKSSLPQAMSTKDIYTRLSGITITWNAFKHFYPYHEEINTDWFKQLPIALGAVFSNKTTTDYVSVLRRLTEKLKDGHIRVSNPSFNDFYNITAGPALVEGKLIIREIDSIPDQAKLPLLPGDEIISINGKSALQKLDSLKRQISGSDQWKTARALPELFSGTKDSEFLLGIKRNNDTQTLKLTRKNYRTPNKKTTIKKLDSGIYFIDISTTKMDEIKKILPELVKAKGIKCDLRGYPTNNHEFINYLLTENDNNKWMFVPKITYPDFEKVSYDGIGWNLKPSTPHISAKVIFLTGGGAISYAESYMSFIKYYQLATIVGQPTAGANGNVNRFSIPGGISISFTGMKVKQQDGSQLQGIGIQPDIFITETQKAIREGRDEYLEKALELLK
ncbi:MAG: S41 family peptidase [Pedobacter sp.]|uniref:S41 family peptidase n=1 Tax=Pedobacter sp. TaxID=1411316 RepID=UPI00356A0A1F